MSALALASCVDQEDPPFEEESVASASQAVFDNSNYPITQATINTPEVTRSAMQCSRVVRVQGVHQGAQVRVLDATNQVIGQATNAPPGAVDVFLNRALVAGEQIRAQQSVNGFDSQISLATTVSQAPASINQPEILYDVYECSVGTVTHGLMPGALVTLTQNGNPISPPRWVTYGEHHFSHASLDGNNGREIEVTQSLCNEAGTMTASSPIRPLLREPNPLNPPRTFQPQAGTKWVRADGLIPGARLSIERLTPNPTTFSSWANGRDVSVDIGLIADNSRFKVSQQLCRPPVSDKPVTAQPSSNLQDPSVFGPPKILEPVCASAKEVLAKPSLQEGELVLKTSRGGGPMVYKKRAPVGGTEDFSALSVVGVPWAAGDRIQLLQIIESGFESRPTNATVVASGSKLHAHNLSQYVDQISGEAFQGITQEEQSGPAFTYQECCPVRDGVFVPQDAQAIVEKMDGAGNSLGTVKSFTMQEQSPGRYSGRWLWFEAQSTQRPEDDYRYRVTVASRCNNPNGVLNFRVVTGKVNTADPTPPESVLLNLSSSPTSSSVSQNSGAVSVTIAPGKVSNLTVAGFDPEGLKKVQIVSASNKVSAPAVKNVLPQAPIAKKVFWTTNLRALDPLEQVVLRVEATNFAGAITSTAELTVTAGTATPQINVVNPTAFYKEDRLDISGSSLYYNSPNLQTRVRFSVPARSSERVVIVDATTAGLSQSNQGFIKGLQNPLTLVTKPLDIVNISVGLGQPGQSDSQFQWSAPFAATAMEREAGAWTKVEYSNLSRSNKLCSGGLGSLSAVRLAVLNLGPGRQEITLGFDRKGGATTPIIEFETLDYQNPDPNSNEVATIGGYYLSSNCRTLAVLDFTGYQLLGGANIPQFSSSFHYFPESGPPLPSKTLVNTGLFRHRSQNSVKTQEFVPRPWSMHISPDATVATITHVNTNVTVMSNPEISVSGSIQDLLKGSNSEIGQTSSFTCADADDCRSSTSHSNKRVTIRVTRGPTSSLVDLLSEDLN